MFYIWKIVFFKIRLRGGFSDGKIVGFFLFWGFEYYNVGGISVKCLLFF